MRTALGIVLLLTTAGAAFGQASEAEQRQACMGDAMRFCAGAIPDRQKVQACLVANRHQVSPACQGVMERSDPGRQPRRG